jgi:uncharacterized protein YebE (UPF0316 family)
MAVVAISTMRIIFIGRGLKAMAAGLGFFEVTIWLFAIGQVMTNLDSPVCFAAFAGGFVAGNYLGMSLEQRLAIGSVLVRVITGGDSRQLVALLRDAGCGVTRIGAHGLQGPVEIVFTVIRRRRLGEVLALVRQFDADAFYSIDELQASASRSACGPPDEARAPCGMVQGSNGLRDVAPAAGLVSMPPDDGEPGRSSTA